MQNRFLPIGRSFCFWFTGLLALALMQGCHRPALTAHSPDGRYVLEFYTHQQLFAMPGQGGFGSRPVSVYLRDSKGRTLGFARSDSECSITYDMVKIEWSAEFVCFAAARCFDLKTGQSGC
ncbi:MAG: hypothetical protein KDK39_18015 [Leptospiraceae bacterium]|nr:hypothetical protein [Leptospiraceae bacterium]